MEICDWLVFSETFADGPARWYARHPQADFLLTDESFDELVARIWMLELGVPVPASPRR